MAGTKVKERNIYVHLPEQLDRKISIIAQTLPIKDDGTKWHKKDVIRLACEKLVDKFDEFFAGVETMEELISKGSEVDVGELAIDMPQEGTGLSDF